MPKFRDVSALSGEEPSASASGDEAVNVLMSNGTPATKLVAVEENHSCISEGARKPVLTDPRSARPCTTWSREENLPVVVDPKSL
jgi:hypothetical protein